MKKVILSIAAMMVTSAAVFAQPFTNGDVTFTESFGGTGTSCLKNFTNGGYAFADGNVAGAANDANAITLTAAAAPAAGVATGVFDFYYTNASNNCVPMRTANVGVDMSGTGVAPTIIVRAKASAAGVTAQFHIGSAPNSYPTMTSASIAVPVAQTEKTLTTSYVDYTVDFSGTQWNGTTAAQKQKVNVWGVLIPSGNATNNGATIMIESITITGVVTGNTNANVVNDQVTLAPNPAQGSFNVDMTSMNNSEAATVKVMNTNGVIVKEISSTNPVENITTEGMNKGIYMVQVTSGNKIATKKVVVE